MSGLIELAARIEAAEAEHRSALDACRAAQEHARKTGSELHEATRAWNAARPQVIAALRARASGEGEG